jgi:hypothetical protein
MRDIGFLLAHHRPEEHDRCYKIGAVRLCARCAGLYPALAAMLALQLSGVLGPPRADWAVVFLLPLPALVSWGRRRLFGAPGSNPVSTLTGALLGIALGRSLHLYLRDPASVWFWAQIGGLTLVVLVVEIARLLERKRST